MISALFFFKTTTTTTMDQHHNKENTILLLLVSSILALIFQAAHQSLHSHCLDLNSFFQQQSLSFYEFAQQLFINMTFSSTKKNQQTLMDLTFVSILLLHYQCVNINEEQAYMTLQLGMGYASRCGIYDNNNTNAQSNILKKSLLGWQSWIAFYLQRDHLFQDAFMISSCKKDQDYKEEMRNDDDHHSWVLNILDGYTDFFWKLKNDDLKSMDIMYRLKRMENWSATFNIPQSTNNNKENSKSLKQSISANILSIYHHILTIQVLSCQQPILRRYSNASQEESLPSSFENNHISTPNSPTSMNGSLDQTLIKKEIMDTVMNDVEEDSFFPFSIRSSLFIMNAIEEMNAGDTLLDTQQQQPDHCPFIHPVIRHPLSVITSLLTVLTYPLNEIISLSSFSSTSSFSTNHGYIKQKSVQEYITRIPTILQIIISPFHFVHPLLKSVYDMLTKLKSISDLQLNINNDQQETTIPSSTTFPNNNNINTNSNNININTTISIPQIPMTNTTESISPVVARPNIGQKRQMAIPTKISHRPAIDQQQIDKLSSNKAILSDPYSVRTNNASKRKSTSSILSQQQQLQPQQQPQQRQQVTVHKRKKSLPNDLSYGISLSQQEPQIIPTTSSSTSLLPVISSSSSSTSSLVNNSSASMISSRYLDQLNGLSDQQIYTAECLAAAANADNNMWMTIVENNPLATQPPPPPPPSSSQQQHLVTTSSPISLSSSSSLSSFSMNFIGNNHNHNHNNNSIHNNDGIHSNIHKSKQYPTDSVPFDNNTNNGLVPKKKLPLLPQPKNNPTVPKTWSAVSSLDWNKFFNSEVSQTLHTNSSSPFHLDSSYGTVENIPIHVATANTTHPTPPDQDDALYIFPPTAAATATATTATAAATGTTTVQQSQTQHYHYHQHHHHATQQQQQLTTPTNSNWMTAAQDTNGVASTYY
ncbi:unnamed protein product [Cunninghamella echinulata]